jgi:hypothetical protein
MNGAGLLAMVANESKISTFACHKKDAVGGAGEGSTQKDGQACRFDKIFHFPATGSQELDGSMNLAGVPHEAVGMLSWNAMRQVVVS